MQASQIGLQWFPWGPHRLHEELERHVGVGGACTVDVSRGSNLHHLGGVVPGRHTPWEQSASGIFRTACLVTPHDVGLLAGSGEMQCGGGGLEFATDLHHIRYTTQSSGSLKRR